MPVKFQQEKFHPLSEEKEDQSALIWETAIVPTSLFTLTEKEKPLSKRVYLRNHDMKTEIVREKNWSFCTLLATTGAENKQNFLTLQCG